MEYAANPDEEQLLDRLEFLLAPTVVALVAGAPASLRVVAGATILDDIWSAVSTLLSFPGGIYNWLSGKVQDLLNWITSTTGNVKTFLQGVIEFAVNGAKDLINVVLGVVNGIGGAVSSAASWLWGLIQPAISAVSDFVSTIAGWIVDTLAAALHAGWDFVAALGSWIVDTLKSALNAGWDFVRSLVDWLWSRILPVFDWVQTQVSAGVNWLASFVAQQAESLGQRVISVGDWVAGQTFNYVIQGAAALGDGFQSALEWLMSGAFGTFAGTINDVLSVPSKMLTGAYQNSSQILADLHLGPGDPGFTRFLYSLAAFIPTLASLAVGLGPIYAADALQGANKIVGPQLYSLTDARDGWLRGIIPDAELDEQLARMGYNPRLRAVLRELFFEPAPPSDLTRFLVREVFDPQSRQELALDSDYPAAADAEARKVGLSPETMRNYWAAHWQLPSPSQVYEMLHRGFIDSAAVDRYLKAADYSPAWRNNLARISYNVPGRIDLRRMYAAGTIDRDRLQRGYLDLGYNPADAEALTRFAVTLATGHPKALPRGVITEAYRRGELTRQEASDQLHELGFDAGDAQLFLDLEDLDEARELQDLSEDAIEADLKAGVVTEAQALASLSAIGVPARRAQLLVNKWRSRHSVKPFQLSISQVQQAVREKLLPDALALQRFAALGVNAGDAQILLALAHPQSPPDEPPALSVGQLFKGRREGLLNDAGLRDRLLRKGYSPDDATFLVELSTPDAPVQEAPELTKAELIAAAKKGTLPVDAVQRRLAAKGYSAQDVDTLLRTQGFNITPTGQLVSYPRRDLTVAQLSKSFSKGLIEEKEFRFRLAELAYAEEDIDLLVELATPEPPEAA